ncbi:hypothetical protein GGQ88_000298 [Novosphingobium hassiacum]|uniref:Uncharacterized protein n=1 Tax=Novosphingobium hassiacum TaxID=173676 RepID=A0A7W5ZS90_9SPHN|nr:hypothetical protein [Novosphingobium hassiacum]MBB3859058.1 hypothetical protein [Novosphingobium hassiacum]
MPSIAHILASLALLLPATVVDPSAEWSWDSGWDVASLPSGAPLSGTTFDPAFVAEGLGDDTWNQVRIEQRVIIRIAPRISGQSFALPSPTPDFPRFRERKTAKCLPIASIAGVQADTPDRLLLITRNRKLIGASLDKTCRARDFYSGFYVERNEDGQLCAGRDIIHSRAGANCAVTKMRELVQDDD